jgi:hypothetical protein
MQEVQFEVNGPNDGFQLMLRRQGWHLTGYKPVYADPNVIRPQPLAPWGDSAVAVVSFYTAFGDTTARQLVRAVFSRSRTRQGLERICGNIEKLDSTLTFLEWCRILAHEGELWTKGAPCSGIDNTGSTLEWYVAEWFRRDLQVPARHGVTLREVPRGGDLDVVAFVNDIRVFVECKTGWPESISESDIRWFLQRAHDFSPEIAVLLIDTKDSISKPVRLVGKVWGEMGWLENHPGATKIPEETPTALPPAQEQLDSPGLYWPARNVFLTNVIKSMDASLSAILRMYYSYARHGTFASTTNRWDFIERRILSRSEASQPSDDDRSSSAEE